MRGGIIAQANRYLGSFCSSQRIFLPHIIQVLLEVEHPALISCTEAGSSMPTRSHVHQRRPPTHLKKLGESITPWRHGQSERVERTS